MFCCIFQVFIGSDPISVLPGYLAETLIASGASHYDTITPANVGGSATALATITGGAASEAQEDGEDTTPTVRAIVAPFDLENNPPGSTLAGAGVELEKVHLHATVSAETARLSTTEAKAAEARAKAFEAKALEIKTTGCSVLLPQPFVDGVDPTMESHHATAAGVPSHENSVVRPPGAGGICIDHVLLLQQGVVIR